MAKRLQEILDNIAKQEKKLEERKAVLTKSVGNLKKGKAEKKKKGRRGRRGYILRLRRRV